MIKGQGGIMGKERLLQLEEYIKVQQKVSPETLCEKFGVSMSTLRRDINTLEQMGCVQKAYGCILYNYSAAKIIPFHVRSTINQEQKRDACAAAASLIQDNDTIFIDSGSTTCHLMDFMASFKNLTVITSNLDNIKGNLHGEHQPAGLFRGTEPQKQLPVSSNRHGYIKPF